MPEQHQQQLILRRHYVTANAFFHNFTVVVLMHRLKDGFPSILETDRKWIEIRLQDALMAQP